MRLSLVLGLLFIGACASHSNAVNELELVRSRASFDFNCEERKISAQSSSKELYSAKGCGHEGTYKIQCSLGPCKALKANQL